MNDSRSMKKNPPGFGGNFRHYFEMKNYIGTFKNPAFKMKAENEVCGDRAELQISREGKARVRVFGCPPSIAVVNVLAELIEQCPEALKQTVPETIIDRIGGLPSTKRHAAYLACDLLRGYLQFLS